MTNPPTRDARAACEGMWALFDSTSTEDHREAAAICAGCPVRLACAVRLREELAIGRTLRNAGGGPRGTWAGRLMGKPRIPKQAKCATDSGYFRHRRLHEDVCDECRIAHRLANQSRVEKAS